MLSSTVTPARDNPLRMSTTFAALVLSSPVVGSSRNMIPGLVSSSVAMETLRFSPPLSPRVNSSPMRLSATFTRPNSRIHPATTLYASLLAVSGGNRSAALNIRCSHTVDVPGSTSVCCTYPLACRTSRADTASPSSLTVPCATCPRGVGRRESRAASTFPRPTGRGSRRAPTRRRPSRPSETRASCPRHWPRPCPRPLVRFRRRRRLRPFSASDRRIPRRSGGFVSSPRTASTASPSRRTR